LGGNDFFDPDLNSHARQKIAQEPFSEDKKRSFATTKNGWGLLLVKNLVSY
jgi:hypothetical protein